jgi:ATP-dependent Zn protease
MPRNNALGFVSFSESDKYINQTKGYFESNICVSLAGRIAQAKKFGKENIDSGARSDLESANKLIYKAITRYGMDDILTNLNVSIFDEKENIYRNDMIFQRMQVWLTELTLKTEKVIDDNWETIEKLAIILIDKEQVDGRLLDELF